MDIHILVAEDDEHIGNTIQAFLRDAGYHVELCADGNSAAARLYDAKFHLVILDIMLPGMDGQEILKDFRTVSDAPVIMITALSGDSHEIRAFDNLADDFIAKPFSMQVLIRRVEALLRRSGLLRNEIRVGKLSLNLETYTARWDGEDLPLTLREFEILSLLANNDARVLSHETILARLWGYDYYGNEGTVHTHIKNLRSKLPEDIIKTVRGVGYTLTPPGSPP
ncbi:MAG: response regulator transcription factor [Treponema sp.]|jgi:two-component system response regulator VanR|nr:response regulator transcription factor [Treponema sp.]